MYESCMPHKIVWELIWLKNCNSCIKDLQESIVCPMQVAIQHTNRKNRVLQCWLWIQPKKEFRGGSKMVNWWLKTTVKLPYKSTDLIIHKPFNLEHLAQMPLPFCSGLRLTTVQPDTSHKIFCEILQSILNRILIHISQSALIMLGKCSPLLWILPALLVKRNGSAESESRFVVSESAVFTHSFSIISNHMYATWARFVSTTLSVLHYEVQNLHLINVIQRCYLKYSSASGFLIDYICCMTHACLAK